jgi:integral membrane protein
MLKTPLGRYRLLAYIVGVGLVVLVFIGVPLRYGLDFPYIAKYVGMLHGFLYIVYCLACLELVLRYRLHIVRLLLMAAAGFVPFLSFVMERKTTQLLQAREAAERVQPSGLSASAK